MKRPMCRQTSSTQLGKPLHQIKLHGGHLTFATVWLQLRWPLEVPPTPQGHCWQLELRDTQVSSKPWQHPPQQDSLVADPHRHHLGSGQWRHWHGNPGWADFENLVRHQYHVFINIYIYMWWQGTCHWLAAPKSSQRVWHVHGHV